MSALAFLAGLLIGAGLTLLAVKPRRSAVHWQIGRISYTRSGEISSLSLWGVRRMRAGQTVQWVRAA